MGPSRRVLLHAGRKITNVRKRRDRKSEADFKESKRDYRQSNEDQIEPGSHKEESSHNPEKSGQSQYHHQESKTDSSFAEKVALHIPEFLVLLTLAVAVAMNFS